MYVCMYVCMYDGKQQLALANLLGVAWPLALWGGSLREGGRRMSEHGQAWESSKSMKTIGFYKVWRLCGTPGCHTCSALHFKFIDISLEVSQKSTFWK